MCETFKELISQKNLNIYDKTHRLFDLKTIDYKINDKFYKER